MGELARQLGVAKNALSGLVDRIGTPRARAEGDTPVRSAGGHPQYDRARKGDRRRALRRRRRSMPDIAGALPADERRRLADSIARITAPSV